MYIYVHIYKHMLDIKYDTTCDRGFINKKQGV